MKRCLAVFLSICFFASLADAQQRAETKQPPAASKRLSSYMRDAGLLYIEAVDHAVDPEDIRAAGLRKDAFAAVDSLADRIEIHAESPEDKEFFTSGLQRMRGAAWLTAKLIDVGMSGQQLRDVAKIYITCQTELRDMIKAGQFYSDALTRACTAQPAKKPESQ